MKFHFPFRSGTTVALIAGSVVGLGVFAFRAQADAWDKKTVLTVNEPIQVQDTYLEPGTYVLKLLDSSSDRHIVQIFNRDQNHLINTVMAINNYRLEPTGKSQFTFYETPKGTARAMHAWFYPGDNYGQEFRYPKELRQIAAVTQTQTQILEQRPPEPPPPPIVTQPADVEPAPQAAVETPKQEEPVEIAQATPPATPPPPAAEPAPAPAAEPAPAAPTELPKTATPFPLMGLGGLISLATYSLLRLK
jgi:hypothetical protein